MRVTAAVVLVLALAVGGCGGNGGADSPAAATSAQESTPTEASAEDTSSFREVNAQVEGRTLNGHCSGTPSDAPAVMLEVGMAADANQNQLVKIEEYLEDKTVVCAYDRAGVGSSDPPLDTPRPLAELIADSDAFSSATEVEPPYILVGFSAGGAIAFMYAQAKPDKVAGLVSINPVPPAKPFLSLAKAVETRGEYASEIGFYEGTNEESVDFTQTARMLTEPLPAGMPYVVMFDEDCGGAADFCGRIFPPLKRVTKLLAGVGEGGRFMHVTGAGHNIDQTRPEVVYRTIDEILAAAGKR